MSYAATIDRHRFIIERFSKFRLALIKAVESGEDYVEPRDGLMNFLNREVLDDLAVEQSVLYRAAAENGEAGLGAAMTTDHRELVMQIQRLEEATTGLYACMVVNALDSLLYLRIRKEEEVLLPALEAAGIDVHHLLKGEALESGE